MYLSDRPHQGTRRPLVGRKRDQAMLRQALDVMLAGNGSLVLVSGDAGIGKTSLLDDLSRHVESDNLLVFWGHAYDLTSTPPYGPWLEILRQCRRLGEGFPQLPPFIGDAGALARVGSQDALFSAVATYFQEIAATCPLVLILDDLHWADQASLDFLRFFARQIVSRRILLVASYRTDELHRKHVLYTFLPLLVRETNAKRLVVRPLNAGGQRALIRQHYTLDANDQARLEQFLADPCGRQPPLWRRNSCAHWKTSACWHSKASAGHSVTSNRCVFPRSSSR